MTENLKEPCQNCGRPFGEHARQGLNKENINCWMWYTNACPTGNTPFSPTEVFKGYQ